MHYSQKLIRNLAPIDSALYARSVREDTAELASYALSDRASAQNSSPPTHQRLAQNQLEDYFAHDSESSSTSNREADRFPSDIIQEVSEPVSPEQGSSPQPWKSPGISALTDLFRRSPPKESSAIADIGGHDTYNRGSHSGDRPGIETEQEPPVISSNSTGGHATERSPLISRAPVLDSRHISWAPGQQDLEGQEIIRTGPSLSTLRKVILWPREKGYTIAKTVVNPKRWNRHAIWQHAVVEPVSCLPAVALGLLLNILDALSYGKLLT